ncbi:MAG: prepilin-type N-terminal cleavage/methylation domain-containing protein [Nitrospinae bacterium]|nr:prepilin-type N-terminal cleavage/methylation domain-containing protein [Nitrospinota bacterium]
MSRALVREVARAERGFTLLEVLVALAIFAMILAILFGTYAASVERAEHSRERAQVYHEARVLLELMANDLRATYMTEPIEQSQQTLQQPKARSYTFIGEDFEEDRLPFDKLTLYALLPSLRPDTPEVEVCRIAYSLEPKAPPAQGKILFRRVNCSLDPEATEEEHVFPLTDVVRGLGFTYYDEQGHERSAWDSRDGQAGKRLPTQVKIMLMLADNQGFLRLFERLTDIVLAH